MSLGPRALLKNAFQDLLSYSSHTRINLLLLLFSELNSYRSKAAMVWKEDKVILSEEVTSWVSMFARRETVLEYQDSRMVPESYVLPLNHLHWPLSFAIPRQYNSSAFNNCISRGHLIELTCHTWALHPNWVTVGLHLLRIDKNAWDGGRLGKLMPDAPMG